MPKKFDQDAKDRVVRLVEDRILAENISTQEACKIVAPKLGVSWHTARQWTQAARREGRVVELKALQPMHSPMERPHMGKQKDKSIKR